MDELRVTVLALLMLAAALPARAASATGRGLCGSYPGRERTALAEHAEQLGRLGPPVRAASAGAASADVGQIAVLKDEGDLVLAKNYFDLRGAGVEFAPGGSGYTVTRLDRPVAADAGTPLALGDDDAVAVTLPFAFPFFGKTYSQVFVNSDGNLTLGAGESSSLQRDLGRFLSGPPRIAPFFVDLNPGGGGRVTAGAESGRLLVTWTGVPQYGIPDANTFQVALYPDGRISFAWASDVNTNLESGVVGIAPGGYQGGVAGVDLSTAAGATGPAALAESFHTSDTLDTVAVSRKFYLTHPDDYQQLVVFTSRRLRGNDYFAYELTVRNPDTGIGASVVDWGAGFGSAARMESFVTMDYVGKYPDDPAEVFFGTNSTLSIVGQEVGHRWAAFALFKDGDRVSRELLGRDGAHWSFFMDSDASHMEGNDIADLGGGRFQTVAGTQRYSALDQYLMGFRPAEEVPPFFLVRDPGGVSGVQAGAAPEVGVSFTGTRRDVSIGEVIAALGPRNPAPGPRPPFREAFVFVDEGTQDPGPALAKVERIRAAWEPFFARSTDGRGAVDARLH
jgi:hypothetical protein